MQRLIRQVALEEEMVRGGVERYNSNIRKSRESDREDLTPLVQPLLKGAVEEVAKGVAEFLEATANKRGNRQVSTKYLEMVPPEVAAFLALKGTLSNITKPRQLQSVAMIVASLVEDEVRFKGFEEEYRALWNTLLKDLASRTGSYIHKRRVLVSRFNDYRAKSGKAAWVHWPQADKLHLGVKLVDIIIKRTGLVERTKKAKSRKDTQWVVSPAPKTLEWMNNRSREIQDLTPTYTPMVVEPRPWTGPYSGGYLTNLPRPIKMVKSWLHGYLQDLSAVDMPEVYKALNHVQGVPWKVNTKVLEVALSLWDGDGENDVMPRRDPELLPVKPADIDTNEDALKEWKKRASAIHNRNAHTIPHRIRTLHTLNIAEKFKDDEEIYFPHQLDWRGRLYPVPQFLQPQGDDLAKGLLTFVEGEPLGVTGIYWLGVHGANCFGEDKLPLKERVKWVMDNNEKVRECGEDPFTNRFWMEADDPWQFLAFCFEWAAMRREGADYVCSLPVKLDGTCNGLQNFAAMLLDEGTAAAVNLTPGDTPQDIYQRVADEVNRLIEDDITGDTEDAELAILWRGRVDRKVCKRPTMTLPYGATLFGFRNQILNDTMKPMKAADPDWYPFQGVEFKAAHYLARKAWEALGNVVSGARAAMDWLHEMANVMSQDQLPLLWTTPVGLPVLQDYRKGWNRRIKTQLAGGVVYLTLIDAGKPSKSNVNKQISGISPNFVHSMDAAHCMSTVNACFEGIEGFHSFAGVHDSFGTVPAHVDQLRDTLRRTFVEQYSVNRLELFRTEQESQRTTAEGLDLPPAPTRGSLELSQVNKSDYFFA